MAEMGFIEALNSINSREKINIIRESDSPEAAEKQYPPFPVLRSLSYSLDSVLFINELNIRGLSQFNVSNLMHYEFLLYLIPPAKRFNKWVKVEKNETIENIIKYYNVSFDKARDIYDILTEEQRKELDKIYEKK